MRILILHSRYLSGAASGENRVAEDEADLLLRAGHDVVMWAPAPSTNGVASLAATATSAVWSRAAARQVTALVRQHGAEVVHVHNLFPMLSPAVLTAARDAGAVVVTTLHNYRMTCLPATLLRDGRVCEDCLGRPVAWPGIVHRCYRGSRLGSATVAGSLALHRVARSFDAVRRYLAVSEFVLRKHVEAGLARERLRVKRNFAWEAPLREGPGTHFLYLGRVAAEKGLDILIRAWRPGLGELLVAGDGPDRSRLENAAPPGVRFIGMIDPRHVPDLVRASRALIIPAIWYEPAPRAIIEAYASGVPVLASRIGGLEELVEDGVSGLLVEPRDVAAWRHAMERLLDDGLSLSLGEGAWRLWQEAYSPQHGLRGLEEAYREAIG